MGTNDARVEKRIESGDEKAKCLRRDVLSGRETRRAMYTVLAGDVDAILITGGIARSEYAIAYITERVKKLAPIFVYPGEDEMEALAMNGLMALNGEVEVREY
jgi:butyrate kinase